MLSLSFVKLFAQQPTEEWVARWPLMSNPVHSNGKSIKQDGQGYIYVLADTGLGFGFLKYNQQGALLFSTHHSPIGNWTAGGSTDFIVTQNGDIFITGLVYIELDMWIYTVKFNSDGILQWNRLYNRDINDGVEGLLLDNVGNLIIYGGAYDGDTAYALLIKYNPNGDTLWTNYYNHGQVNINNREACIDENNNIYTSGHTGIGARCIIKKHSSNGNLIWVRTFTLDPGRPNLGWGGIALDNNMNIYLLGTQVRPQSITDSYLLKLRNNGDTAWSRTYPDFGPGNYSLRGPLISINNNEIYYTATFYAQNSGYDIGTLKYDSSGNQQWIKTFNAGLVGGINIPSMIKFDENENIYVCGGGDFPSTGHDFIILKYYPNGIMNWMTRYIGPVTGGRDFANDLIIDSNRIISTGNSRKSVNSLSDAITIEYDQILAVNSSTGSIPRSYKLFQNYPNPFNNSTMISYSLSKDSHAKLEIYSITGQKVITIVNSLQQAGIYSVIINMGEYASGLYFYKLIVENIFSETKKLIYIK